MTDLQLGLLIIGAAAVVGVLVYNRFQERATRRDAERSFGSRHADALLDEPAQRREPTLEPAERREPTLEPAPRRLTPAGGRAPDTRIDYVIEISGASYGALGAQWAALEHRFAPRAVLHAGPDGKVLAALQMVSRAGVVSESQLLEFRSQVETLAASHRAKVSAPQMRTALEAAQRLDAYCAEVDIQVAIHVLGVPADLEMAGEPPFQLARREDGVTLTLDVPRTADFLNGFDAMVRNARALVAAHGGRLADDNGKPLDDRGLAAIGVELQAVRGRFTELDIEPGSTLAQRLFS
jgi:hypothetical protein